MAAPSVWRGNRSAKRVACSFFAQRKAWGSRMILSGQQIGQRIGQDIVIEPFEEERLNPNSYNLTLHHELMVYEEVVLDMAKANLVRRVPIPEKGSS